MIVIDHAALHDIAERIFTAAGSDLDEARTIADYLVEAICAVMTATASA